MWATFLAVVHILALYATALILALFTLLNLDSVVIVFWCGLAAIFCAVEGFMAVSRFTSREDLNDS